MFGHHFLHIICWNLVGYSQLRSKVCDIRSRSSTDWTTLTLNRLRWFGQFPCFGVLCVPTPLLTQNNQLTNCMEKERFRLQNRRRLRHLPITSVVPNRLFGLLYYFCHVIDWPPWSFFKPLPASEDGLQWDNRLVDMIKTYPNHLNLFIFNACCQGPSTLQPTSELLSKFSLFFLLVLRW